MGQQKKRYHVFLEFYVDEPDSVDIVTKEDDVHIQARVEYNEGGEGIPN